MAKINQEEYELLKSLRDSWRWIARDNDTILWVYEKETKKYGYCWDNLSGVCERVDSDSFQFIQWEDSEPYNISELIEGYEGEETEVKNKEWLKEEVLELQSNGNDETNQTEAEKEIGSLQKWAWNTCVNRVYDLINQLDEPEAEQSDKKIRELETYNDDLVRDNNQLRNAMDNQEVLSQGWIGQKSIATHVDTTNGDIQVTFILDDLQNLLVPKQELPVIPQFVSSWIEETKKQRKSLVYAIAHIYDKNGIDESPSKEENRIFQWMEAYDNDEVFARAWLDGYTIKKEPKYNVKIKAKSSSGTVGIFLYKQGDEVLSGDNFEAYNPKEDKYRLTEYEIKKYDERFWPFRKPLEELEENGVKLHHKPSQETNTLSTSAKTTKQED